MICYPFKLLLCIGLAFFFSEGICQTNSSIDTISTIIPVTQNRDANTYNWNTRHQEVLTLNKQRPPKVVFIGNSIIHYWGGEPVAPIRRGEDSWNHYFQTKDVRNLGFGYDRIENALWRVQNGELDGYVASHIVLLAGTNNLSENSDAEILTGIEFLVGAIKQRQTKAKIILMGILPRRSHEHRILIVNKGIAHIANKLNMPYVDTGKMFLGKDNKINESLFSDGVHPTKMGYNLLAPLIDGYLQ